MSKLNRNQKRQLVYQLLSETTLTATQKRQYRDWTPERVTRELNLQKKKGTIEVRDKTSRVDEIITALKRTIEPPKAKRGIQYQDIKFSNKQYLDKYNYVVSYQTGDKHKKGKKKTEYVTVTDNVKLSKKEVMERVKGFFNTGKLNKYNTVNIFVGSLNVDEAYINNKLEDGNSEDFDFEEDY